MVKILGGIFEKVTINTPNTRLLKQYELYF